jgi:2-oxoisovalerate dehydrogenase E2 component (dihydrolipoyl transacylase)
MSLQREELIRLIAPSPARDIPDSAASSGRTNEERIPLSRIRRLTAERMTLSKTTISHAWQAQEVDMSGVAANIRAHRQAFLEREGFSLTYLPYVVAAAAQALRSHPLLNATFAGDHLVLRRQIHIGIAMGLENGVVVPAVRDADGLSIARVAAAINDLRNRAGAGRLRPEDLSGTTFTVNNTGTFGTVVSYAVITPGQAGILTMGAVKDRAVPLAGQVVTRPVMFLSLSLDHRVLDGLAAARFVSACRDRLERTTDRDSLY